MKELYIKILEHKKDKPDSHSFMVEDIFGLSEDIKEVIEVSDMYIDKKMRGREIGKYIISQALEVYKDSIICLATGAIKREYPEEPSVEEYDKLLEGLSRYYTRLGFVSINNYVGYEHHEAFIYPNKAGKWVLNLINSLLKKDSTIIKPMDKF